VAGRCGGWFHQVDLAGKRLLGGDTGGFLAVQLRQERAAATGHDVERLHQVVTHDGAPLGGRIVASQPRHLPPTALVTGRVVADQVSGHDGCLRPPASFGASGTLLSVQPCHVWRQLVVKAPAPDGGKRRRLPGSFGQEPAETGQTAAALYGAKQARQRPRATAQEQREEHGHAGPELRTTEGVRERAGELAQARVYAYNRDSHRVPLGQGRSQQLPSTAEDAMLSISNG
jgi:hypothetical protein